MIYKVVILSAVLMGATSMVLHQAVPVYIPIQYQEPATNYNFGYEVNNAQTGDYKRLQETRHGDAVVGQYSLLQPDGVTRTVEYRADGENGFNAVVHNVGVPSNGIAERQEKSENDYDAAGRRDERPQEQPWQSPSDQQATSSPSTLSQALIHHILQNWS